MRPERIEPLYRERRPKTLPTLTAAERAVHPIETDEPQNTELTLTATLRKNPFVKGFVDGTVAAGVNLVFLVLSVFAILLGYQLLAPRNLEAAQVAPPTPLQMAEAAPPVVVSPIQILDEIAVPRHFLGKVEAGQTAQLGFDLGGTVTQITVKEGEEVSRGQILAIMDTRILEADRDRLQARRSLTEQQLSNAEEAYERKRALQQRGLGGKDSTEMARNNRDELAGQLIEVDAELRGIEIRMEKSMLRAPFDGFVGSQMADVGETVEAGQWLFSIFERGTQNFRVGMPPQIDPNALQNTQIEIDGVSYPAILASARQDIDTATRTRTVLYTLDGTPENTAIGRPGTLTANVALRMTGAWVPINAMRAGAGGIWTLMTLDAQNVVRAVAVEVFYLGDDQAFVFGAFDTGDRMIVGGAHKVAPGQTVRVPDPQ